MTRNYNLPDDVPFTTASSDFQKLLRVGDNYENKKSLVDYAATDFGSLRTALISYMKTVYPTDYQNFTLPRWPFRPLVQPCRLPINPPALVLKSIG